MWTSSFPESCMFLFKEELQCGLKWIYLSKSDWDWMKPNNTCYVCDKFWAVTLKLSQEVGFSCISRFVMDLHQQKWSGKIHIFNHWNQLYKVKHCHLLAVFYSKPPWLGRGRCPVCAKTLILGKPSWAFTKSAFYDPKHFSTWETKAVQFCTSEYVCYLYFINQAKFMPEVQWLWEYFIKPPVL